MTKCGNCGRESADHTAALVSTGACIRTDSRNCWQIRARRLEAERDAAVALLRAVEWIWCRCPFCGGTEPGDLGHIKDSGHANNCELHPLLIQADCLARIDSGDTKGERGTP